MTFHFRRLIIILLFILTLYLTLQVIFTYFSDTSIDDVDREISLGSSRLIIILLFILTLYLALQKIFTYFSDTSIYDVDRKISLMQVNQLLKSYNKNTVLKNFKKGEVQMCKQPYLPLDFPDIMKLINKASPLFCGIERDWVEVVESSAVITEWAKKKYGEIICSFTDILRKNDYAIHDGMTTKSHTGYSLEESDFLKVYCNSASGTNWQGFIAGARNDEDVGDRTGWSLTPPDSMGYNVLMFGFDSLSRNMFQRNLPNSHKYLTETLGAIVLEGYNIVGDGTPQALIPILTGKTELELPETRRRIHDAKFVNAYPFIWKDYSENGYVTGFMEDTPNVGTFTYRLKGFKEQPTDHYMRTFYLSAGEGHNYCLGSIPKHKIMLNYMSNIMQFHRDKPRFLFGFHGELSHDSYDLVSCADDDLVAWMEKLKKDGVLENTILIIMSDHGSRFLEVRNTQQGKLEERNPFFSFTFPPTFAERFPEAYENFKNNAKMLTTPFDIHATLKAVLHFSGSKTGSLANRSISLFDKIPLERTCADAYIEPHWCSCLEWNEVNMEHESVQKAAQALVDVINTLTASEGTLCSVRTLSAVTWAAKLTPNKMLLHFKGSRDKDGFIADLNGNTLISDVMYQLKIRTDPGGGVFEASITHDQVEDKFHLKESDISRINRYGDQAHCVYENLQHLRKYCYCAQPPPSKMNRISEKSP